MAAFSSNTGFLTRYDARLAGDLVADDGNRVSSGSLASDTNLTTALEDASGEILANSRLRLGGAPRTSWLHVQMTPVDETGASCARRVPREWHAPFSRFRLGCLMWAWQPIHSALEAAVDLDGDLGVEEPVAVQSV